LIPDDCSCTCKVPSGTVGISSRKPGTGNHRSRRHQTEGDREVLTTGSAKFGSETDSEKHTSRKRGRKTGWPSHGAFRLLLFFLEIRLCSRDVGRAYRLDAVLGCPRSACHRMHELSNPSYLVFSSSFPLRDGYVSTAQRAET